MRNLIPELRQALRRAFSRRQVGALAIMALGMTLATVMFAIGRGYSTGNISWRDAGELVVLNMGSTDNLWHDPTLRELLSENLMSSRVNLLPSPHSFFSQALYFNCKKRTDVFASLAAYQGGNITIPLGEEKRVQTESGIRVIKVLPVTPNFFDVLGVSFPGLTEWRAEAKILQPSPAIVTAALAGERGQRREKTGEDGNGGAGQTSTAVRDRFLTERDGHRMIIRGVLPPDFVFQDLNRDTVFVPLPQRQPLTDDITVVKEGKPGQPMYERSIVILGFAVIGRLAPGVTPEQATAMLHAEFAREMEHSYYESIRGRTRIFVRPLAKLLTWRYRQIVLGAYLLSGVILLICAVNLAGIFLVRGNYRLREYALRNALGADLRRLLLLPLLELVFIALVAVVAAWFLTRLTLAVIAGFLPVYHLALGRPTGGLPDLIFLLAGALCVIAIASAPTFAVIVKNYRQGFSYGQMAVFTVNRRMRSLLTFSQAAVTMLLIALCYMTVRGYSDMFRHAPGVDPDTRVVSVSYSPELLPAQISAIVQDTLARSGGAPPDASIAATAGLLVSGGTRMTFTPPGHRDYIEAPWIGVTSEFLRVFDVRLLAGRTLNDDWSRSASAPEYLINRTLAELMGWTPAEAPGKSLYADSPMVVVGVFQDFPFGGLDRDRQPLVLVSLANIIQNRQVMGNSPIHYLIRPDGVARAGNIEKLIKQSDPEAVIIRNTTMDELLRDGVRGRTFATLSVTLFTLAAAGIVITNIVSTVLFIITRRTRDIAIYMALGAPNRSIRWMVTGEMIKAGLWGIAAGGVVSWWAGKAVTHLIYHGDKYHNPLGLVVAAVVMLLIIGGAAWLAASRALGIEPAAALRAE